MPRRAERRSAAAAQDDRSVFINCPFDERYAGLFRAAVFTVYACGYLPRCALEAYDSGEVRIEKICRIIERCRLGLHGISRTELDPGSGLPRFNMPLELGIFLGAQRFGGRVHQRKNCLVVDRERYRYQQFISDIAGQDIAAHGDDLGRLIGVVRDWLRADSGGRQLPGPARLRSRLAEFEAQLPEIAARGEVQVAELTFSDISNIMAEWLRQRAEIG